MRVVVVGAGVAGLRTAEALRDNGFNGELVLVGDELHMPYSRPPLSKQVLRGEHEPTYLRPEDEYPALDLDLRLGIRVHGLDVGARSVLTADGPIAYDEVVVATGAAPRRLPGAPGLVLRSLDDCRVLAAGLRPGARLGVVGAGLIGCEVAASARAMDVDVSVVDVLPMPMVRVLGPHVAGRMLDLHEEHGVRFHLGVGVAAAAPDRLALSDGTELEVDLVLESLGVLPATDWLAGSGLDVDNGVRCDDSGHAQDGVWAVGDVACWSSASGDARRTEHWTSAVEQASVVAAGILGTTRPQPLAPYWWSDQYDVKLQGLGMPAADDDVQVVEVGPRSRPVALYSRDGRLTGVVGFSAAAFVMRLRAQVTDGAPVGDVVASMAPVG